MVGVVAHEGRHVERGGETGLPLARAGSGSARSCRAPFRSRRTAASSTAGRDTSSDRDAARERKMPDSRGRARSRSPPTRASRAARSRARRSSRRALPDAQPRRRRACSATPRSRRAPPLNPPSGPSAPIVRAVVLTFVDSHPLPEADLHVRVTGERQPAAEPPAHPFEGTCLLRIGIASEPDAGCRHVRKRVRARRQAWTEPAYAPASPPSAARRGLAGSIPPGWRCSPGSPPAPSCSSRSSAGRIPSAPSR